MTLRRTFAIGITLLCCLLPHLSAAISGCNNGYLLGNYNAQISSNNLQNVLNAMNNSGSTVTPSGTAATPAVVGFANNPRSLSGTMPGTSRFYFDGNGTIVGNSTTSNGGTFSTAVGSYTVNLDCTATITMAASTNAAGATVPGATFDAVLTDGGKSALFVETDSTGMGTVGTLQKASSCVGLNYPQSFGFSFSGATQQAASSSGSGNGNGTAAAGAFVPFSEIGTISTSGDGSFSLTMTSVNNGAVTRSRAGGTYTVGADCSLKLSFSSAFPGTTANFRAPVSLGGLTTDSSQGLLVLQPDANTSLTGTFVVQ